MYYYNHCHVVDSQFASLCVMVVVMVTMLALGAFLKPLPKVSKFRSQYVNTQFYTK